MRRLLVLALALLACGDNDSTGPEQRLSEELLGTFTLESLDGNALPAVQARDETATLEVLSGSITFNDDGTCVDRSTLRFTEGDRVETDDSVLPCAYTVRGSTVVLQYALGAPGLQATYESGTLTLMDGGVLWLYRR